MDANIVFSWYDSDSCEQMTPAGYKEFLTPDVLQLQRPSTSPT